MPVVLSPIGTITTANAVANHAGGYVTLYWTNPGGSTVSYNRLYHKRAGASFTLLQDNVAASTGSQQSLQVMDQIALSTAYDYAVSAVSAGGGESNLAVIGTGVTIDPLQGGNYSAMLHIQNQGFTYKAPVFLTGGPKIKEVLDAQPSSMFNLSAPVMRYGVSDYRELQIKLRLVDLPTDPLASTAFTNLSNVLKQMRAGATGVYRDVGGTMMTVGFKSDASQNFLAQIYLGMREPDLTFVQVPNTYSPSTTRGFAAGLFQQVNGSILPLSPQELAV